MSVTPLNEEISFGKDEIIVSKTDLKGKLIYANDIFCNVAEMTTREVIGQPHNIIRHPDMPRTVFRILWDTIQAGTELFAYVKNMSKTGKYYWVLAHVTPSYDSAGKIDGFHSNRRFADNNKIDAISKIYDSLNHEEKKHDNPKKAADAGVNLLQQMLAERNKSYSEFIWSMGE